MSIETIGEFEFDKDKLIGKGAWGEVYLGRQKSLNRPVAIKILKSELTADPEFVKRFNREAETLAKVVDEHILQVYSAGEHQGSYYFVMEYVQGQPLSKFIERGRKFSPDEIIYIAESVAKALKTAWESPAKIVHRDIKPSNIMISYSSSLIAPLAQSHQGISESMTVMDINILETKVKVMDFGLAKVSTGDKEATMVGTVIGTPKYISPEQGMGNPADIRSDIYSLGIVMYEMATGRIPFEGETAMSMIRHHIYDTATLPSQYNPEIPPGLEAIIMKCIQKDPNKRYTDPAQLLEDITAFKQQRSPLHASKVALEATLVSDFIPKQKRMRYLYGAFAAVLIMVGFGIYLLVKVTQKPTLPIDTLPRPPRANHQDKQLKEILAQLDDLLARDKLEATYQKLTELDTQYEDHVEVKTRRKTLINKWSKKIQGLMEADQLEEAWTEFNTIPLFIQESDKLRELKASLIKKLDQKVRNQLVERFLQENPDELPEKSYTTKEQKEFNAMLRSLKGGRYPAVYRTLDTAFIDLRDEALSPPAIYFKMKVLAQEKAEGYLAKMEDLLSDLKTHYAASPAVSLAQTLLAESKTRAEDNLYNTFRVGLAEKPLETQLKLLEEFKSKYPQNRHITEIAEAINKIKEEIFHQRRTEYQNLVNEIKNSLTDKAGYLAAAQKLSNVYQLARELSQDTNELTDLEHNIEIGYLDLCGIQPLGNDRLEGLFRFIRTKSDNAELILVPKGEFLMGAYNGNEDEKPEHKVMLSEYYIDKYEVTNTQFAVFVKATGYKTEAENLGKGWVWCDGELKEVKGASWRDPEGDGKGIKDRLDCPVVQVSWNDARAYADWAGKRLPTEAEWEKAARGTDARPYPWGNQWEDNICNNVLTSPARTVPVKDYPKGQSYYGCYQMAGNVAEWCQDFYLADYYKQSPKEDPKGPATGQSHTLRGGSWVHHKKWLRTTARISGNHGRETNFWSNYIGFRCVKDVNKELLPYLSRK